MNKISKVITLLKNRDVRSFLLFTLVHPGTMLSRHATESIPSYLTEDDHVKIKELRSDYSIKKLFFPGISSVHDKAGIIDNQTINIHLAGMDDDIEIQCIDWLKNYSDPEDVAALHRFSWLYRIIWENGIIDDSATNRKIKEIIYSWIDNVECKGKNEVHSEVWQTYSVVERLVSWIIILGLTEKNEDKDEKIVSSIIRQLDHIQKNFEYYGEEFTSNHFCNNGRGLYICGIVLGIEEFTKLGKKIISNMLVRIVPDNKFLREGSVHYQFLITKWVCDCLWIARTFEDHDFADWLTDILKGLLSGCKYFLIRSGERWLIPLIGDISPDLTPNWLIGVPWVAEYLLSGKIDCLIPDTNGYHSILPEYVDVIKNIYSDKKDVQNGSNDWQKINKDTFKIFVHVNNSLYPNNLTGHFHHDSGSFVAYYKNLPLLIDCGRVNYNPDGAGVWMKSCFGHNMFIVDNYNPEPDMRTFYTREFLERYLSDAPKMEKNGNIITAMVCGGSRIKGIDVHKRIVEARNDSIVVRDVIEGFGIHDGTILFHLADIWDVKEKDGSIQLENNAYQFIIRSDDCTFRICSEENDELFYSYFSEEYGKLNRCISLVSSIRFKAPYKITTLIERI